MKVYMSHWTIPTTRELIQKYTNGNNDFPHEVEMVKKSVELLNKAYGEVHFITDNEGAKKFSSIEWASVDTSLNDLPKEYYHTWSLGKIKAYNIIAQKGEPFLHFDGDFFINQRLPKDIEEKPIIFQNTEAAHFNDNYVLYTFRWFCPFKHLASTNNYFTLNSQENCSKEYNGLLPSNAFNCGIVGGSDLDYFFNYSESSLRTVFDPFNKPFWTKNFRELKRYHEGMRSWTLAILAEQYYASLVADQMGKSPYFLSYPNTADPLIEKRIIDWLGSDQLEFEFNEEETNKFKWIHLYGHFKLHYEQIFHKKIYKRDDPFWETSLYNKKYILNKE